MTDAVRLKPCPFCKSNSKPTVMEYDGVGVPGFIVICSAAGWSGQPDRGCGGQSGWAENHEDAILGWNTRAEPATAPDVVKIEPVGWVNHYVFDMIKIEFEKATGPAIHVLSMANQAYNKNTLPLYGPDAMDRINELEKEVEHYHDQYIKEFDLCSKVQKELSEAMKAMEKQEQCWSNALELDLIPARHRDTAGKLRDEARHALTEGQNKPTPTPQREKREYESYIHLWTGGLTPIDPE